MKKILKLFFLLKNIKFTFYRVNQNNILIFDEKGYETIKPFFKGKKHLILKSRGEEINLYIIFKILFDLKSINYISYINKYIEIVNPKYIFHHSVNHRFFFIKKNFPRLKTIFIQSEFIHKTEIIKFKKSGFCDYALLWGKQDLTNFKNISRKSILIGSVLNNYNNEKKIEKYKNSILFISQFRENKNNYFQTNTGKIFKYENFMKADRFGFEVFLNYCKLRKKKLYVLFATRTKAKIKKEIEFYKNKKTNNLIFLKSTKKHYGYKVTQYFNKIFFVNSTLGFECLARNKKCFFLNVRNRFLRFKYINFSIPKNGPNWCNSLDQKIIFNKIDKFMGLEDSQIPKIYEKYFPNIIYYDKDNLKLKFFLNNIFKDISE
ncbi:hypothetical protein OAQ31_00040 [Candidatus Pelagibacter sp.]|nr:hypothetical protein [Candidatus Pelagibacter sp.]